MTAIAFEQRQVLVLNRSWAAVGTSTLADAITMLFKTYKDGTPKARIIDPHQDFALYDWSDWSKLKVEEGKPHIRGVNDTFRIPEIILLSRYDKMFMPKTNFSRRTLYEMYNNQCQYCGDRPGRSELTIDHVLPKSLGGKTTWENCSIACIRCNMQKADRLLKDCRKELVSKEVAKRWHGPSPMRLLTEPKRPKQRLFGVNKKYAYKSWSTFIDGLVSELYWDCELENDNES